jgi:hypothetical protein
MARADLLPTVVPATPPWLERDERPSDSPLVERIMHTRFVGEGGDVTTPDGCWDLVVLRLKGRTQVLQTGLITRPVELGFAEGDEYMCISFKPGVFMPQLPGAQMVDRGLPRPLVSRRSFWLDGDTLEIPTFENAEGLVKKLVRQGTLVRDEIVARSVEGASWAISDRSLQRHFQRALGMPPKSLQQILRARQAVQLLKQGRPAVDVAFELGYADQPHLVRSLKRIMGRTPRELARMPDLGKRGHLEVSVLGSDLLVGAGRL